MVASYIGDPIRDVQVPEVGNYIDCPRYPFSLTSFCSIFARISAGATH